MQREDVREERVFSRYAPKPGATYYRRTSPTEMAAPYHDLAPRGEVKETESVIGNGKSGKSMKEQLAEIDAQLTTAGEEAKELFKEEMSARRGESARVQRMQEAGSVHGERGRRTDPEQERRRRAQSSGSERPPNDCAGVA